MAVAPSYWNLNSSRLFCICISSISYQAIFCSENLLEVENCRIKKVINFPIRGKASTPKFTFITNIGIYSLLFFLWINCLDRWTSCCVMKFITFHEVTAHPIDKVKECIGGVLVARATADSLHTKCVFKIQLKSLLDIIFVENMPKPVFLWW